MKQMCIGFAVGLVAGMVLCGIPQVQRTVNDMKTLVERDVVKPVKDFLQEKKREMKAVVDEMTQD